MLFQVIDEEALDDRRDVHVAARRVAARARPRRGIQSLEERARIGDPVRRAEDERRARLAVAGLDRRETVRIRGCPPERRGAALGRPDQDALDLSDPVAGKLGEVAPDLVLVPALARLGIRIGLARPG